MRLESIRLPLVILVGALAVSFASILIKFARAENIPPLVIAAARMSLASIVLLPLAIARARAEIRALTRRDVAFAILSGITLALHFAFWISSFDYTSVMSSVVLLGTYPLLVAIASVVVLRESLSRAMVLGLGVASIGGFIIGAADLSASRATLTGDVLALGGSLGASAYVLLGRRLRAKLSLLVYVALVYTVAAILLLALAWFSGASVTHYGARGYALLVLVALVPQLLGHTAFNYALKYLSAALVAILLLSEPVGATILAIPFLGEIPSALKLGGGALVLVGIFLATRNARQPAPRAQLAASGELEALSS